MARPSDLPRFKELGERIAWWRKRRGLSRTALADRVRLKYSTIASLEDGDSKSTKHLHRFARVLKVNLQYLETDLGDPEVDAPTGDDTSPLPGVPREKFKGLTSLELKHLETMVKEALVEIEENRQAARRTG